MSSGRGTRRGRMAAAMTTVVALGAFQVLAIIGAGSAAAATACTYNLASQTVTITIDPGQTAGVAVETAAANEDAESPPGAILFDNNGLGYEDGANTTQCGSATNSNTVAINVLGSPGNDETFTIDEYTTDTPFNTAIAWSVDLGSNTVAGVDTLSILLSSEDNNVVLTNTTFDLNGAAGKVLGVELYDVDGDEGDDVIDASAVTFEVNRLHGHGGDDVLMPGTANDGDVWGGPGWDTVSYATRTTCTVIDNAAGVAGHDANCDGDLLDVGDEVDTLSDDFEALESGSGNDTLIGVAGFDEWFIPGDGDDDVTGQAADDDVIDYSSSSAAMSIDPDSGVGTATGQGNDTFSDVYGFVGSAFDDTLLWNSAVWAFAGGDGIDTVDASAKTTAQTIDLDDLDDVAQGGVPAFTADSTENAIGGSGDDNIDGNDLRNVLTGGDGNDDLAGWGGNDTFFGGGGNDTFTGGDGADTVDFGASPAGITADVSLGFASGEGDDSIAGIEIIKGSSFNDFITGGILPFSGGPINFWITGRGGNDRLTGSNSNDYLKGGAGNDKIRGGSGDDSLFGGKGKKDKGWGGKGTDFCKSFEWTKGCE